MKRQWTVQGYDSTTLIYEETFPMSAFTENQMEVFLQRLVCKHLTHEEIASVSRKRSKREEYALIAIVRDGKPKRLILSIGVNPHYTAICGSPYGIERIAPLPLHPPPF